MDPTMNNNEGDVDPILNEEEVGYGVMAAVEEDCQLSIWNKPFYWDGLLTALASDEDLDKAEMAMKILYLDEEDWKAQFEEDALACAEKFWVWVKDILMLGGKYVEELTINFYSDAENRDVEMKVRPLKVHILVCLPKWCPQLKALKIQGSAIELRQDERSLLQKVIDEEAVNMNLQFLELSSSFSSGCMAPLVTKQFLCGSELKTLVVFMEQFLLLPTFAVFPSLTELKVGNFGRLFTREEKFQKRISAMFPGLKKLAFFKMSTDICKGLPRFVNVMCSATKLDEIEVNQSSEDFDNIEDEKMALRTVTIDVHTPFCPSVRVMKHVREVESVRITNSDGKEDRENRILYDLEAFGICNEKVCFRRDVDFE